MARVFINISSHNKNVTHETIFFNDTIIRECLNLSGFVYDPFQRLISHDEFFK